MEIDASKVSVSETIYQVIEELSKLETQQLKFLCSDFIPMGNLESMDTADLMMTLSERRIVTPENYNFLKEGLILIGRLDIAYQLGGGSDYTDKIVDNLDNYISISGLSGFKILIFNIADNLTKEEVKKVVFSLEGKVNISKGKLVTCITGFDLFTHLIKAYFIHPNKLNNLVEIAQRLNRMDLIEKIEAYSASRSGNDTAAPKYKQNIQQETSRRHIPMETDTRNENRNRKITPSDWKELVQCIPSEKQYSFCEDLGISGKKYKNFRDDLGKLLKNSFGQNVFNSSDLVEAIKKLNLNDELSLEEFPAVKDSGKEPDLQRYPMTSRPRGICVIFNNEKFAAHDPRIGSAFDRDALANVFKKFHFEVLVYENLTKNQIQEELKEVASLDHTQYSCFVCCILSHGSKGVIYGTDSQFLPYGMLTVPFRPNNCPGLTGKPKLFFIQACRGTDKQQGTEHEETDYLEADGVSLIPNEADFLMAYSTVDGYSSLRSKSTGSWFIQNLCKVFSENADSFDLTDMLLIVNDKVSQKSGKLAPSEPFIKQVPAPLSTLRKKVFFLEKTN